MSSLRPCRDRARAEGEPEATLAAFDAAGVLGVRATLLDRAAPVGLVFDAAKTVLGRDARGRRGRRKNRVALVVHRRIERSSRGDGALAAKTVARIARIPANYLGKRKTYDFSENGLTGPRASSTNRLPDDEGPETKRATTRGTSASEPKGQPRCRDGIEQIPREELPSSIFENLVVK